MQNKELYEEDYVVDKYATNTTRVRSLNNAEKIFVDRFSIKNKKVLVVGCGAGRVPANLLLYGNTVVGIDRSVKMINAAKNNFPTEKFTALSFMVGDAIDLSMVEDESYDVVFLPMNTIDYVENYSLREKALKEAVKKLKKGGTLAFSSHNKLAYFFSPKVQMRNRTLKSFFGKFGYFTESVVGGGVIFKGNPKFIISETERFTQCKYVGHTTDCRTKIDKLFNKSFFASKLYFPYLLYVFKKEV